MPKAATKRKSKGARSSDQKNRAHGALNKDMQLKLFEKLLYAEFATLPKEEHQKVYQVCMALRHVLSGSHIITQSMNMGHGIPMIVNKIKDALDCNRASVFILDEEKDQLYAEVERGLVIRIPKHAGIAGSSLKNDEVIVVVQSGTVTWISPFTAEFSPITGNQKSFPGGIRHPSNMVQSVSSDSSISSQLIAADGERIRMRCQLKANALGNEIAANIEHVLNEVRYSPESVLVACSQPERRYMSSSPNICISHSPSSPLERNERGAEVLVFLCRF